MSGLSIKSLIMLIFLE